MMNMNSKIEHRKFLAHLCNRYKLLKAVEIGTHQGVFADQFMSQYNGTMTCIDSWTDLPVLPNEMFYPGFIEQNLGREFDYKVAWLVLKTKYDDRVTIFRQNSLAAAKLFRPKEVGFVYIDAAHDRKSVLADIEAWWPIIQKGGIMAGHDYDKKDPSVKGVVSAVKAFAKKRKLKIYVTKEENYPSWYVRKR